MLITTAGARRKTTSKTLFEPRMLSREVLADGRTLRLTFDRSVDAISRDGFTLTASGGAASITPTMPDPVDPYLDYTTGRIIATGETLTLSYIPGEIRSITANTDILRAFSGATVINSSEQTVDEDPPEYVSGSVSADGLTSTFLFDEDITGSTGFTLNASGGAVILSSPVLVPLGISYTNSREIEYDETLTVSYTPGDIEDEMGNSLASFSTLTVYNGSGVGAGTVDGDPVLPQVTPGTLPPSGWDGTADVTLTSVQDLQAAIDAADVSSANYIIELTSGQTWAADQYVIPATVATGANWLIIRCSAFANLPAAGDRLQPSPANDADMAVLVGATWAPYRSMVISPSATAGCKKICFVGIEFRPSAGTDPYRLVDILAATTADRMNTDITLYQCRFTSVGGYCHDKMIRADADNMIISCCDFFASSIVGKQLSDGPCGIRSYSGTGIRIYNNGLNCGGMGVFLSDNEMQPNGILPTDVTIDHNYMTRDMPSQGSLVVSGPMGYQKNPFETKGGRRVLVERNIIENTWVGNQPPANLVVIKNTAAVGGYCEDFLIRNNLFRNGGHCLYVEATNTNVGSRVQRVKFFENLFYDCDWRWCANTFSNTQNSGTITVGRGGTNIKFEHNTFVGPDGYFNSRLHFHTGTNPLPEEKIIDMIIRDNIFAKTYSSGDYDNTWMFQDLTTAINNVAAINLSHTNFEFDHNLCSKWVNLDNNAALTSGNTLHDNIHVALASNIGFSDMGAKDYRILSGPYLTASSTGGLIGCDVAALNTLIANVETGILS